MDLLHALESNQPVDKVVLVGNPGVGKSTIFQRFKTGRFVREEELTHHDKEGQECYKEWAVGDSQVSMTLYDTAGVERYTQTIPPTYFRKARVVLLVYSVESSDSFHAISSNWIDNTTATDDSSIMVLVGNKCDIDRDEEVERAIPRHRAETLATNLDIEMTLVFEVSALTGKGFKELFDAVAVRMLDLPAISSPALSDQNTDSGHRDRCSIGRC